MTAANRYGAWNEFRDTDGAIHEMIGCHECGALVVSIQRHDKFHDDAKADA